MSQVTISLNQLKSCPKHILSPSHWIPEHKTEECQRGSNKVQFWAYLHTSGDIKVKRYFFKLDLEEADESPFVAKRTNPFYARTFEEARKKAEKYLIN